MNSNPKMLMSALGVMALAVAALSPTAPASAQTASRQGYEQSRGGVYGPSWASGQAYATDPDQRDPHNNR
jgi:hypothetical protein